jgi:hypothetical protein
VTAQPERLSPREAFRRILAGRALHARLSGVAIPAHPAGTRDGRPLDRFARANARELLAILKDVYGVPWWDPESFERAFVHGALEGWRPGSLIQRSATGLRVVSTTCPIASDVEKDPRLCDACRALQAHAAYVALLGQVEDARVDRVMSRGESACELNVAYRREPPRARP